MRSAIILVLVLAAAGCRTGDPPGKEPPVSDEETFEQETVQEDEAALEPLPEFDRLWNFQKPDETEKAFRGLQMRADLQGDLEYRLQLRTQIARTLGLQEKFDDAHALLDKVALQLTPETPIAHCRYLLERGRAVNSGGDKAGSIPYFEEAWERSRKAGADKYAIDAAHMLGIVCSEDDSLAWSEKGMQVARDTEDESQRGWLGVFYNNIGHGYLSRGNAEKALEYFVLNRDFQKDRKSAYWKGVSRWCVGRALRDLGRHDEALEIHRALEAEYAESDREDGYVFEEIAENLHAQGDADAARPYFAKAYEKLAAMKWLEKAEPERLARLKQLGQ